MEEQLKGSPCIPYNHMYRLLGGNLRLPKNSNINGAYWFIRNCAICIWIIGGNDDKACCIFILDVVWKLHFVFLCVWQFSVHWWRMMGSFLTTSNACAVLTMLRWIRVVTINTTLRVNARKSTSGRLMTDDWWTQEVPPHKVPPSRTFWGGTSWG